MAAPTSTTGTNSATALHHYAGLNSAHGFSTDDIREGDFMTTTLGADELHGFLRY